MIVRKNHARGAPAHSKLHHLRCAYTGGVGGSVRETLEAQQGAPVVQRGNIKFFGRLGKKVRHQKFGGGRWAVQRPPRIPLVLKIVCTHLGDEFQHGGTGRPNAGHLHKLFIRCVQRCGKAAKGADNTVCEAVCISARMCQKQKKFHGVVLFKPHQAFAQKPVIYALPMLVVLPHVYPSCGFISFYYLR